MKPINATSTRVHVGPLSWLKNSKIRMPLLVYHGYEILDHAAQVGSGFGTRKSVDVGPFFEEYRRNLPLPLTKWVPNLPEVVTPKGVLHRELEFFDIADRDVFPNMMMPPSQIISWLKVKLGSVCLKPSRLKNLFSDPVAQIQLGYRLIRLAGRKGFGIGSGLVAAGLCLVGLGELGVPLRRCDKCFRRVAAGQLRCRLHSRSKYSLSIDVYANARTVRQIRMAERTLGALNWPQDLDPVVKSTDSLIVVCHILWRLDERDQAPWIEVLTRALDQAPLIQSKLSTDFLELGSAAQLTELRNLIDEHEWTPSRWPAKIAAAEDWFLALQHFCKPRTRGLSEQNRRRVAQASNWINEGTPKKLVAERLGISKSHLSKLLERAQKGMS